MASVNVASGGGGDEFTPHVPHVGAAPVPVTLLSHKVGLPLIPLMLTLDATGRAALESIEEEHERWDGLS
jgi:hypothetical protein